MKNYLLNLTKTKFAHGLFMAIGGAIGTAIYTSIQSGQFPETWVAFKPILMGGVIAGATYILKNMGFGSGSPVKS